MNQESTLLQVSKLINADLHAEVMLLSNAIKSRDARINQMAHLSNNVHAHNAELVKENEGLIRELDAHIGERDSALAAFDKVAKERDSLRAEVNSLTVENGRLQREWDAAHADNYALIRQHREDSDRFERFSSAEKDLLDAIDRWRSYANDKCLEIEALQARIRQLENATVKFREPGATGPGYLPQDWEKIMGGLGGIGGK